MAILVRIARIIGLVDEIFQFSQRGGQQRLIRAHTEVMAVNLEEAYLRHTVDFALRLEAQELYERPLGNDVNARSHQQLNGRCAGSSQCFPRKLEATPLAVPLCDDEVKPPALSLAFPLGAKLMRPCCEVDAIFGDMQPTPSKQCG